MPLRREQVDEILHELYKSNDQFDKTIDEINSIRGTFEMDESLRQSGEEYVIKAFIWAVTTGNDKMVSLMIDKGMDVNNIEIEKLYGQTALMLATEYGHLNIVERLIAAKADPNRQLEHRPSALRLAIEYLATPANHGLDGPGPGIIKALVHAGANIREKNDKLLFDIKNNTFKNTALIQSVLKDCGLDLKTKDELEQELFVLIIEGKTEDIKILINGNPDIINIRDHARRTPLLAATIGGQKDIVKLLLSAGADVNAKDRDGTTALTVSLLQLANIPSSKEAIDAALVNMPEDQKADILASLSNRKDIAAALIAMSSPEEIARNKYIFEQNVLELSDQTKCRYIVDILNDPINYISEHKEAVLSIIDTTVQKLTLEKDSLIKQAISLRDPGKQHSMAVLIEQYDNTLKYLGNIVKKMHDGNLSMTDLSKALSNISQPNSVFDLKFDQPKEYPQVRDKADKPLDQKF